MGIYQIDDTIINHFINGDDIELYRYDNVYAFGPDNEKYFIEPNPLLINKARLISEGIKNIINELTLESDELVLKYIGDIKTYLENIVIKLVVGLPLGYRRMFKSDETNGKLNIIIDVTNNLTEEDDVDLYLSDFKDFIEYAIILMILDSKGPSTIDDGYTTLTHGIYASSFACYISQSRQLEMLDSINFIQMIEYDEYKILKKVLKVNKKANVSRYISLVVQTNPEMIILGITGKRYLSSIDDDKALELYNLGAEEFCKAIVQSKEVKDRSFLPLMVQLLNRCVVLASGILAGFVVYTMFKGVSLALNVFVLLYLGILLFRNFVENKIGLMTNKKFLIFGSVITIIAIVYILIML